MKAIVVNNYGPPDVLKLVDIEKPTPKQNELLIRVRASSINSADDRMMRAKPFMIRFMGMGFLRPKQSIPGIDMAGVVEAVGEGVTRFKPGDEIYGDVASAKTGAYTEYVCVPEDCNIVTKPKNMTFEQAAAVPVAGVTALQALKDRAQIKAGDKVLINGASGGVGTFAVILSKAFGVEVTGVCSTRNCELVSSIGADHVVDYQTQDIKYLDRQFDVIIDIAANITADDYQHLLASGGRGVLVGFSTWMHMVGILLKSKRLLQRHGLIVQVLGNADVNHQNLDVLREMMESGQITPVIDKTYPLAQTSEAMRYFEEEHARAKVVITI